MWSQGFLWIEILGVGSVHKMECWAAWSRVKEEMVMCEGIGETLINKVYLVAGTTVRMYNSWYN